MTTPRTLDDRLQRQLSDLAECFDAPCLVDAPLLAQDLLGRNRDVSAFTDQSDFAELPGFRRWSVAQPIYVADEFDFVLLIARDRVPSEVFSAMRVLTHFHYDTPVVVVTPKASASRVGAAMERFELVELPPPSPDF